MRTESCCLHGLCRKTRSCMFSAQRVGISPCRVPKNDPDYIATVRRVTAACMIRKHDLGVA